MSQVQKTEKMPAISVIVPVYRPGEGFLRCISSLREQAFQDFEVIFVDDRGGGEDMRIAEETVQKDDRFRILKNEVNAGPGISRNRGIEAARGKYLLFLDADDYVGQDFLLLLYQKAEETGAQITCGVSVYMKEDGTRSDIQPGYDLLSRIENGLKQEKPFYTLFLYGHQSALYLREWIMETGVRYGETRHGEDTTFLLRACHKAERLAVEAEALGYYVQREGSLTHVFSAQRLNEQLGALEDQLDYVIENIPDADPDYVRRRIFYPLSVHRVACVMGCEQEAQAFLDAVRQQIKRLPSLEKLEEADGVIFALNRFGVNLLSRSSALLDDRDEAKVCLHALKENVAFAYAHYENTNLYKQLLKESLTRALRLGKRLLAKDKKLFFSYMLRLTKILITPCGPQKGFLNKAQRKFIAAAINRIIWRIRNKISYKCRRLHPIKGMKTVLGRRVKRAAGYYRLKKMQHYKPVKTEWTLSEHPKISVVLPVYNPGEGLKKCLYTLQHQTLSQIEMIFVDDLGQDNAMEIIREAAKGDPRIRILVNEQNVGAGVSRNRGLEAANGEYVCFADPDDYVGYDFLERLYNAAVKENADIAKGERQRVDMQGRLIRAHDVYLLNDNIRRGLKRGEPLFLLFTYNHWTAIFRRKFIMESGARYGMAYNAQDTTFLLKACRAAKSIVFDDDALYFYVSRAGSRMRDFTLFRLEQELFSVKERVSFLLECPEKNRYDVIYIYRQINYCLRLHETLAHQNAALGEYFLGGLQQQIRQLPYLSELTRRYPDIKALMQYDVTLTAFPYRAQESVMEIDSWFRVLHNWNAFFDEHPSWQEPCKWLFKETVYRMFGSDEMRRLSWRGKIAARREVRRCICSLPDQEIVLNGARDLKLLAYTGIDLIKVFQIAKRVLYNQP